MHSDIKPKNIPSSATSQLQWASNRSHDLPLIKRSCYNHCEYKQFIPQAVTLPATLGAS